MNFGQLTQQTIPALLEENGHLRAVNQGLLSQVERLGAKNKELSDRLSQLEERLRINSSNSSKPPSQDPFRKARQSQSSGRKPGGQPGHPGHTRQMAPSDQIARIVEVRPEICLRCGTGISETDSIAVRHHQADESSWRCKGRKYWLWTGATSMATFFYIDPSRSQEAFERIFSGFGNTLTTDRYGAYNPYLSAKQTCLAHIRRDLTKMSERPGADGAIGRILSDQLDELFGLWHQYKDQKLSRVALQQQAQKSIENFRIALTFGASSDGLNSKSTALCNDLLRRFATLWTFLFQDGVEPTNNLAERSLRPAVIYRKLTGGSQSDWGMTFIERLLTVACTFRQQARNIYSFLIGVFRAHILSEPAPPVFEF